MRKARTFHWLGGGCGLGIFGACLAELRATLCVLQSTPDLAYPFIISKSSLIDWDLASPSFAAIAAALGTFGRLGF